MPSLNAAVVTSAENKHKKMGASSALFINCSFIVIHLGDLLKQMYN